MANEPKDKNSSIVMKAIDATTFSELQAFGKDLESRPTERLLRDVEDLVKPSDSKAQIVAYTIALKFRRADAQERAKILTSLEKTIKRMQPGEMQDRVSAIVDRLRNHEN